MFIYNEAFGEPPPGADPPMMIRDAIAVASGGNFALILRKDGTLWGFGGNEYGQLGNDMPNKVGVRKRVDGLSDVVAIAAGLRHGLALKSDGTVWQWGQDDLPFEYYAYEHRVKPDERAPKGFNPKVRQVEGLPHITKIVAGSKTSYALDDSGHVWVWGVSDTGQIPLFSKSDIKKAGWRTAYLVKPYLIDEPTDVVDIKAASTYAIALRKDGTVWGWGSNKNGRIGQSEFTKSIVHKSPAEINGMESPRPMRGITNVKQIFANDTYTAVLKNDNSLWVLGSGCRLCGYGIARHYPFVLKTKGWSGAKVLLEFNMNHPHVGTPGSIGRKIDRNTEFGIYWIDDSSGHVDGFAPWDLGYAKVALSPNRAMTIWETPPEMGTKDYREVDARRYLALYIISGGTITQWRERNPDNDPAKKPVAWFSFPMPNLGGLHAATVEANAMRASVSWNGEKKESDGANSGPPLGPSVGIRGVGSIPYEELPNHRLE